MDLKNLLNKPTCENIESRMKIITYAFVLTFVLLLFFHLQGSSPFLNSLLFMAGIAMSGYALYNIWNYPKTTCS